MVSEKCNVVGVDLFAGAGGLSLGAAMAGVEVPLAVELDKHAAETYVANHPRTKLIVDDIRNVHQINVPTKDKVSILFGGPPCQGFSTSNQRSRNRENRLNWLFKEFVRIVGLWKPDWVVFENVRGIVETEGGLFRDSLISDLRSEGYTCSCGILCASNFGVPQIRSRFFLIASRHGITVDMPKPNTIHPITVRQAISDLPSLPNGANQDYLVYPQKESSKYARSMRKGEKGCSGHLVTRNASKIIERYEFIPQGGNWRDIPEQLMLNYTDRTRCHTGIYYRLLENKPSVVLGNYRKNMLVHPWENRGLSVREAARLQSFPDTYKFQGSIGFQQQQVGNAVPPQLAKSIFEVIIRKVQ
ncbi:DNA cytosine methyltransferase [Dethiobacter alkaliphilus]|uniref:DNA cytosine methyltransferase n=1 Tax=Dethiobacter alkaliphilus TaxID=427926 RepID=UPI0022267ABC|nr:DNA cytosine methyltransferase [Dethiobacter alkaliphilus]MCW3490233.1 DNA cytosine methyltransferase [Dethiobacter alkaliphilus]